MLVLKLKGFNISVDADSFFVALYAMAVFALSLEAEGLNQVAKIRLVKAVAKYSFGIYIIHPFFLNVLQKLFRVVPDILPAFIGEVVFWGIAFAGAYVSTWILCRIKPFRWMLLGAA